MITKKGVREYAAQAADKHATGVERMKILVDRGERSPVLVEVLATFRCRIGGKYFHFAVTPNTSNPFRPAVITERCSGRRVCDCSVLERYLKRYRALDKLDFKARGKLALAAYIESLYGNSCVYNGDVEEQLRNAFDFAPAVGTEYLQTVKRQNEAGIKAINQATNPPPDQESQS